MNLDQATYERIEAYLQDRLSREEKLTFEATMRQDKDLAQEVSLQAELMHGLEEEALKAELKVLHKELESNAGNDGGASFFSDNWPWIGGMIVVLGLLLWGLIPSPRSDDPLPDEPIELQDSLPGQIALPIPTDSQPSPEEVIDKPFPVHEDFHEEEEEQRNSKIVTDSTTAGPPARTEEITTSDTTDSLPTTEATLQDSLIPEPAPTLPDLPRGMVLMDGGSFLMGGKGREGPQHEVNLAGFFIDQTEVTVSAYCRFLNAQSEEVIDRDLPEWLLTDPRAGSKIRRIGKRFEAARGREQHPVTAITWEGARAYARWAGKRLPTEAEWEFAARGGNLSRGYPYAGSSQPQAISWNELNAQGSTQAVGLKAPNEAGLYDMSGNVWEWCRDYYGPYPATAQSQPTGPPRGAQRVTRGGSYKDLNSLRVTARRGIAPTSGAANLGFRCVRDLP